MSAKLLSTLVIGFFLCNQVAYSASASCVHKFGPKTFKPKVECDAIISSDVNIFVSIGWVKEANLREAKLCIYDEQFFGDMNPGKDVLSGRDKAITVMLMSTYDNEFHSPEYTEEINVLGAYKDYLTKGKSELEIIGKSWQGFDVDDTLKISLNNVHREVTYFKGMNSYLTFSGFKYKAFVHLKFGNCKFK